MAEKFRNASCCLSEALKKVGKLELPVFCTFLRYSRNRRLSSLKAWICCGVKRVSRPSEASAALNSGVIHVGERMKLIILRTSMVGKVRVLDLGTFLLSFPSSVQIIFTFGPSRR